MTRTEMVVLKMNLLGGMNTYICENANDERIWEAWIMGGVPDGADETDLREIAENNELWTACCVLFGKLTKEMGCY